MVLRLFPVGIGENHRAARAPKVERGRPSTDAGVDGLFSESIYFASFSPSERRPARSAQRSSSYVRVNDHDGRYASVAPAAAAAAVNVRRCRNVHGTGAPVAVFEIVRAGFFVLRLRKTADDDDDDAREQLRTNTTTALIAPPIIVTVIIITRVCKLMDYGGRGGGGREGGRRP